MQPSPGGHPRGPGGPVRGAIECGKLGSVLGVCRTLHRTPVLTMPSRRCRAALAALLLPLGLLSVGLLPVGSTAEAAELEVALDRPVMVYVDGKPLDNEDGSMNIGIGDLGAGRHLVEVRNLLGKRITELSVELAADEVVRLRYRDKTLSEIGRGPSTAAAAAVSSAEASAAEAQARAAEAEARAAEAEARAAQAEAAAAARTSSPAGGTASVGAQAGGMNVSISISGMPEDMPAGFGATVGVGAVQGSGGRDVASAAFAGVDPQLFTITLDGRDVPWMPHMGAFVAPSLRPGTVPFVLYLDGKRALSADFTTTPGRHSACVILVEPFDYKTSCADGGRALLKSDLRGGHVGGPPAGHPPTPPPPVEPPPPEPMSEGALVGLIAAVEGASFSDDQVSVLATAAAGNHFTCAQVVRLIEPISFGDSKVEAVSAMRPAILDPENAWQLEQAFSFSSDKEEVRALFR